MQILSLNIDGYKIFNPSPKLKFSPDISLLIGVNGSGKSTVLEAIAILFAEVKKYCEDGKTRERQFNFAIEYSFYKRTVKEETSTTQETSLEIKHISLTSQKESGLDYTMAVGGEIITNYTEMVEYLPDNLVFYYAGFCDTLGKIVDEVADEQAEKLYRTRNQDNFQAIVEQFSKEIIYISKEHYPLLFLLNYIDREQRIPLTKKNFQLNSIALCFQKPKDFGSEDYLDFYNLKGFLRNYLDNFIKYSQPLELDHETEEPFLMVEYHRAFLETVEELNGLSDDLRLNHTRYIAFHLINLLFHTGILNRIVVSIKDEAGHIFDISHFSEGEQQLITIEAIKNILCKDNTVLFLDEPDSFLHPQRQRELMPHVKTIFTESPVQVIATTHSPFVAQSVNASNILLFEANGQVRNNIEHVLDYKVIANELFGIDKRFNESIELKIAEFIVYRNKIMSNSFIDKTIFQNLVDEINNFGEETSIIINRELAQLKTLKGFELEWKK